MQTDFKINEENEMTNFILSIQREGERDMGGDYTNYVGVVNVSKEFGPVEYGFAFVVDLSHSGKKDSHTENFLTLIPFMEFEDFKQLCNENNIEIIYERARKF